jgi:hypothetical protein
MENADMSCFVKHIKESGANKRKNEAKISFL